MTSYLDIAYDLNRLEQLSDTHLSKQLINEIRFSALSDDDVNWKEYFFRLADLIEPLLEERYNDGWHDAAEKYDY